MMIIYLVILIIVQTSYALTLEPTTGSSDSTEVRKYCNTKRKVYFIDQSVITTFTTMTSNDKVTSSLPETTEATTSFDGVKYRLKFSIII